MFSASKRTDILYKSTKSITKIRTRKMSSESSYMKLTKINVNDYVEKKNGLSYLSWAWAWDQMMRVDPSASVEYHDPQKFGETLMVSCTVTAFGIPRRMHLPVMDHRNKAIANPDAFAVNTAMQRCMVKAIAMHGLGLYIYAGEDLPPGDNNEDTEFLRKVASELVDLVEQQNNPSQAYDYLGHQRLDNEQKLKLWGILKPNSTTRAQIKAEGERRTAHDRAMAQLATE